tara:strand:+ start:217 stop:1461 length:1245 start_codon:yes stop_codon:yes gene_type:complete
MSQTEVQLIKTDAVQTGDIANSAVTDAKIAGLTSSKLTGALPAISGAALTNLPASGKAKNLIINGAMQVAQRGTSSTTSGYGTVDRFVVNYSGTDEAPTQAQVDVASGTSPYTSGFRKALKITNGNQTSGAGATDSVNFGHKIEAQDIANSGWNYTSTSSFITLQFWIKSSVAQVFYGYLQTRDGTGYSYPFSTGSLSADTWTKVTKTIPGNSNLQFDNDNGSGLEFYINGFLGTDYTDNSRSLDSWAVQADATHFPDMTSTWYTTNDATLEFTGVQLEVGDSATDFEHRTFGEELAKCQRYFYTFQNANEAGEYMAWGIYLGTGKMMSVWYLPVQMRTNATVSFPTGTNYYNIYRANGGDQFDSLGSILGPSKFMGDRFVNIEIQSNVSSTGGYSGTISAGNTAVYVHFSAEL